MLFELNSTVLEQASRGLYPNLMKRYLKTIAKILKTSDDEGRS